MSKLGQVLVYDSNVDLRDKSPGGSGYQPTTLGNAGQFIDGALTGKNIYYVKSNGTAAENGQALIAEYAKAATPEAGTKFLTFGKELGAASDVEFIGNRSAEFSTGLQPLILKDANGATSTYRWNITFIQYSGIFGKTFIYYNSLEFVKGTPMPFGDVVQLGIPFTPESVLVVAPGLYEFASDFTINQYTSIVSADGQRSIKISGADVVYAYTGSNKISIISGLDVENRILLNTNTQETVFKNCKGGAYSFTGITEDAALNDFIFEDCEGGAYSFFGGDGTTPLPNIAFGGTVKNCKAGQKSFGSNSAFIRNILFEDCISNNGASDTQSFAYAAVGVRDTKFINCIGNGSDFFSSVPSGGTFISNIVKGCFSGGGSFGSFSTDLTNVEFIDCTATNIRSFGWASSGGSYDTLRFINCVGLGDDSFGPNTGTYQALCINCVGETNGTFMGNTSNTLKLINCVKHTGNFSNAVGTGGAVLNCVSNASTSPTLVNS